MTVSRLRHIPGIGVDVMGDAADAANDPSILRLENLDTDVPPPTGAGAVLVDAHELGLPPAELSTRPFERGRASQSRR